jgi:predicted glycosyltransferase
LNGSETLQKFFLKRSSTPIHVLLDILDMIQRRKDMEERRKTTEAIDARGAFGQTGEGWTGIAD